jgi:hypothetical protein
MCAKGFIYRPGAGRITGGYDLASSKLNEAKAHRYPQIEFRGLTAGVRGNGRSGVVTGQDK